jgi:hypothetical protein
MVSDTQRDAGHSRMSDVMIHLDGGQISCRVRAGSGPPLLLIPGSWHDMSES